MKEKTNSRTMKTTKFILYWGMVVKEVSEKRFKYAYARKLYDVLQMYDVETIYETASTWADEYMKECETCYDCNCTYCEKTEINFFRKKFHDLFSSCSGESIKELILQDE